MNIKLLQLTVHVVGCVGVEIPVGINSIGVDGVGRMVPTAATTTSTTSRVTHIVVEVAVLALLAAPCTMPLVLADLTLLAVTTVTAVTTMGRCSTRTAATRVVDEEVGSSVVATVATGATVPRKAGVVAASTLYNKVGRVGGGLHGDA